MDNVVGKKPQKEGDDVRLTRRERRAAIRAAFGRFFPVLLLVIGSFLVVGILMYFWLQ